MIREILKKVTEEAVKEILPTTDPIEINLEYPSDFAHGDFSTNIALVLGKKNKMNPLTLAIDLVAKIHTFKPEEVAKVEVAGPGFINFYLSPAFFDKAITKISTEEQFGKGESLAGKKVIIDYTDPNPFKQFHIGHLMSNAIGESVSRLIEWSGAEIKRVCYQGDVGRHVALTIWGIRKMKDPFPDEKETLAKKIAYIGKAYALGATAVKDDPSLEPEIQKLNKLVYDRSDEEVNSLYDAGKEWSLEHFEEIYAKLDTHFDQYIFESVCTPVGLELVKSNMKEGVFEESEGAVIFPGEKYDLHTRVFITKEGLPTYEAKELGLAKIKYDSFPADTSIVLTASEQSQYFKVLLKAAGFVIPQIAKTMQHVSHGMLRLPTGKMSSRTGDVITGEALISEAESRAGEKIKDREFNEEEKKTVAETVAIGAIKYSILKQSPGKDIIFDLEQALSFEGDSGPYLQYAYVRTMSVLEKAKGRAEEEVSAQSAPTREISDLEKLLIRFADIVERAGKEYAPQHITTYLIAVAGAFNSFYANTPILDAGADTPYRIALTKATSIVLKNGLTILGIRTPLKM